MRLYRETSLAQLVGRRNFCTKPNDATSRLWVRARNSLGHAAGRNARLPGAVLGLFVVAPSALTVTARLLYSPAYCQDGTEVQTPEADLEFSWAILWDFIKPQLLALLGAIVVSNMKLP